MAFDEYLINELEKYGQVLTVQLAEEAEPCTFERDHEVEILERHLDHAKNNSFILLGPSGTGKTAILHEFIRRIGRRGEPWLVLETSTTVMMSGTVYIGEWQTRLQGLIDLAKRDKNIAVFFNDVFNVVGAGTTSKSDENMGDAIAPYVENGEFVLIGECTPDLYRRGVEKHSKFKKLFTLFRIQDQTEEQVAKVVEKVCEHRAGKVLDEHGALLKFSNNTLKAIQEFGRLYFPGNCPPGGAVNLIDHLVNWKVDQIDKGEINNPEQDIQYEDVIQTLQSFTGIPGQLLDDSKALSLPEVRSFFDSRVIGQSSAVSSVVDTITLIKAGLTDPGKPMSVMFFVGPTGVGKTELAKALAEFIFGSADRMIRFDMSEFKDYHSFHKLIGDQNAREDSAMQSGSLLTKVRQQPFSVILLDEIEKAHHNIFDILLQLFDDGRLTDPMGRTTNFTQTIIIMTSNLASNVSTSGSFGFTQDDADNQIQEAVKRAMESFFRPEWINRIDRIVNFQTLKREEVKIIAQRELGQVLIRSGIVRRELRVDVDPGVIDTLVEKGFSELYGARPLKRAVEELCLLPIARQIVGMTGEDRQALLRLTPSADLIAVKIVKDRQTRKSESLARGVTVVDPIRGTRNKLKPKQIEELIEELCEVVASLENQCAEKRLEETKSEYVEQMSAIDFWDDAEAARNVMSDVYRIERTLDAVARVCRRTDDLKKLFSETQQTADAEKLTAVADRLFSVRQHADLIGYSLKCRNQLDRSDAFIRITSVDHEVEQNLVQQMAEMYLNWAKLKGFPTYIVHEEPLPPKFTKEVILMIEGVAIYGMLSGEEGMHEFVYGKTSKAPRESNFVKVQVLPVVDQRDVQLLDGDVTTQRHRAKGTGVLCKRFRSHLTLRHQPSLVSISAQSELSTDEATDLLHDLLRAEIYRRNLLTEQPVGVAEHGEIEEAVRRYTLRPETLAKDLRTNITTHNLSDLWAGAIDEFLTAAVNARDESEEQEALPR